MASHVLVDPEEAVITLEPTDDSLTFLVTEREDCMGLQKFQILANHYEVDGIKSHSIQRGSVWRITGPGVKEQRQAILDLGLFFNPVSQVCVEMCYDA